MNQWGGGSLAASRFRKQQQQPQQQQQKYESTIVRKMNNSDVNMKQAETWILCCCMFCESERMIACSPWHWIASIDD